MIKKSLTQSERVAGQYRFNFAAAVVHERVANARVGDFSGEVITACDCDATKSAADDEVIEVNHKQIEEVVLTQ